ncbi:MAG: 16S rRNA (cytidine(1402)-2'-O)-methyltransferase [Flavobacteriales bacterium]|jgi:16S rRNA (cytidine1402-2'-O)-methyltransferase|nr:16S rRNA (cytidine(1402)-2'-O)-methyltransferase [Flavobacteriales bacterium]
MAKLYIVPTPIGNLGDITYRAIEVLKDVSMILAEDTRVTKKLLTHYSISTPLRSYHQHNEHKIIDEIVSKIKMGDQMAIVSDAGTPGISDPGFLLVRKCKEDGIDVECLPGATALIPALVNSGIPSDRFYFEGFLPQKKGRKSRIETLLNFDKTVVLYESTHRILKLLKEVKEVDSSRHLSVSRELTKKFEENVQGTAQQLLLHFETNSTKGEFVVVIQGNKA